MDTIILAGGLGTRLGSLTAERPKPMMPIAGVPFLEYLISQITEFNVSKIILSVGYKSRVIKDYFGCATKKSVPIQYSEETEPLGTGGAIKNSQSLLSTNDFIVINGDSFFNINFSSIIEYHLDNHAICTIALKRSHSLKRYGKVSLDKYNNITEFKEKRGEQHGLINGGVYLFNKDIFQYIPHGRSSLEKEIFPLLLKSSRIFKGVVFDDYFIDIGIPEDYKRAQQEFVNIFQQA